MRLVIPPPSETQRRFFAEKHKYVAFGGARGGGKSWAVRVKAVLLCERYPGIKVMIVRKTYPELRANHIVPLCALLRCGAAEGEALAGYNDARKEIAFPNGSVILFRHCATDRDADRFQGTEVDVLFVDEATQQTEERMDRLKACVRGVNAFPKRVYYTCNPGGVGHGWVKRLFLDRRFHSGERAEDYAFIRSLVTTRIMSGSWRRCLPSCGRPGSTATGTFLRGSSLRSFAQRPIWRPPAQRAAVSMRRRFGNRAAGHT